MAEYFSGYINEYNVATRDRGANVLLYEVTTDYGFTFKANGQFNANGDYEDNTVELEDTKSDGYGVVAAYETPVGLEIGIGYAASTETYGNGSERGTSDTYSLAAKYTNDSGVWIGVMYQGGSIYYNNAGTPIEDADYNAVDAYAGYSFGQNTVNVTYSNFSADEATELNIHFTAIEYARYIGNMAFYGAYKFNLLDSNEGGIGDNREDELLLGILSVNVIINTLLAL